MAQPTKELDTTISEEKSTPLELANSWLNFRSGVVQYQIERTEQSINFNLTYEAKPPVRSPDIESGSMDENDYRIAQLEYEQSPYEQEEEVDNLRDERMASIDELLAIREQKERLTQGDTTLITALAKRETERRAKIAEEERLAAERKRLQEEKAKGKEMEGATEVEILLRQVTDLVRTRQVTQYKKGAGGWEAGWHCPKDKTDLRDLFDYNKDGHALNVRVRSDEGEGISVEIDDFRNSKPSPKKEKYNLQYPIDIGKRLHFTVKNGRVFSWDKGETERDRQWGYPSYNEIRSDEPFEQADFDEACVILQELASDMASLAIKSS